MLDNFIRKSSLRKQTTQKQLRTERTHDLEPGDLKTYSSHFLDVPGLPARLAVENRKQAACPQ